MKTQTLELTGGKEGFLTALNKTTPHCRFITYEHGRGWSAGSKFIEAGEHPEVYQYNGGWLRAEDYEGIEAIILKGLADYAAWHAEGAAKLDAELAKYTNDEDED